MTIAVAGLAVAGWTGRGEPRGAAARASADAIAPVDSTRPVSAAWLAILPDGETKRRFVLECANCHVFDERMAFPEGRPRTRESWEQWTRVMLSFAGASTAFPILSPSREPESTAAWLVENLPSDPPAPVSSSARVERLRVTPFAVPGEAELPHDVAVDGEGRIIVTGMLSGRMLVLEPATGEWSVVAIPVEDANPRAVEVDADGVWWVVLGGPHMIARHDPASGEWTTWDVGMYPHELARDAEGRVWFNGHFTKEPELIGYVDVATGEVRTFEVPTDPMPDGGTTIPYGLRVGPDGMVWMTQLIGSRLVRFDPVTEAFEVYPLPTSYSGPRRHDVGPDGSVWIPEFANNRLARFDPAAQTFTEYELPVPDALPYVARVDRRNGTVWVATAAADAVFRFDPGEEAFARVPLPLTDAFVRHIDVDPRTGAVWGATGAFPPHDPTVFRIDPDP